MCIHNSPAPNEGAFCPHRNRDPSLEFHLQLLLLTSNATRLSYSGSVHLFPPLFYFFAGSCSGPKRDCWNHFWFIQNYSRLPIYAQAIRSASWVACFSRTFRLFWYYIITFLWSTGENTQATIRLWWFGCLVWALVVLIVTNLATAESCSALNGFGDDAGYSIFLQWYLPPFRGAELFRFALVHWGFLSLGKICGSATGLNYASWLPCSA